MEKNLKTLVAEWNEIIIDNDKKEKNYWYKHKEIHSHIKDNFINVNPKNITTEKLEHLAKDYRRWYLQITDTAHKDFLTWFDLVIKNIEYTIEQRSKKTEPQMVEITLDTIFKDEKAKIRTLNFLIEKKVINPTTNIFNNQTITIKDFIGFIKKLHDTGYLRKKPTNAQVVIICSLFGLETKYNTVTHAKPDDTTLSIQPYS